MYINTHRIRPKSVNLKRLHIFFILFSSNILTAQITSRNLAYSIDTSLSIKNKYFYKVPEVGKKNLELIFNEVLSIQDSLFSNEFEVKQKIKYNNSTSINLTFYFKAETLSDLELLYKFNDFAQIYYNDSVILDLNICRQKFKENFYLSFDSHNVIVDSKFKKFNKKFRDYIKENFHYNRNMLDSSPLFLNRNKEVVSIEVLNANDDENPDILVNDIQGEKIANSLTDFWIYSPLERDLIYVKKLSTPIWRINKKTRIFYSGWHMSALEGNEWCFKIIETRAIKQRRCR